MKYKKDMVECKDTQQQIKKLPPPFKYGEGVEGKDKKWATCLDYKMRWDTSFYIYLYFLLWCNISILLAFLDFSTFNGVYVPYSYFRNHNFLVAFQPLPGCNLWYFPIQNIVMMMEVISILQKNFTFLHFDFILLL